MAKNTNSKYTYLMFAEDVKKLCKGEIEVTPELIEKVTAKADDLIATQVKKQEYNAKNPKKTAAKGASEETKAKATAISGVLTAEPMTADEINTALGTEYTALQVANAVKFIEGVQSTKVIRSKKNAKGLTQEKEYTAYFIG